MPLTRYHILENDVTTAGGIVQATTNPIVFNVGGKKQSCIGDNVWCPACQSMGQIIPSGPRLSFSLGSAMPALNDDLCLCKCSPPPKLINSQTSFKEIIDDNRLAQYQQARKQYQQSKLQNNFANTQANNDDFPKFTVHFRRDDNYQGGYGFDWLRDEYIYPLVEVNGQKQKLLSSNDGDMIKEYRQFKKQSIKELDNIDNPNYTPAWLTLFAPTNSVGVSQVSLNLRIDPDETNTQPLTDNGIALSFECSQGLQIATPTFSLDQVLSKMTKQQIHFDETIIIQESNKYSSKQESKALIYHQSQNPIITISCTQSFNELGYVKVFSQKNGIKKQVGLLCVYPNAEIKKAIIQPVFINTIHPESKTHPLKMIGKEHLTQLEINDAIRSQFLNQALIQAEVRSIQVLDLYANHSQKEIVKFLLKYKHTNNNDSLKDYLNDISRTIPQDKDSFEFLKDMIELYNTMKNEIINNNQQTTYLFFVDYIYNDKNSSDSGISLADFTNEQAINLCRVDNVCNHWKNVALVYYSQSKAKILHTTRHELGHSFGLAHTFLHENDMHPENLVYFLRGYTDNIMDYTFTKFTDHNNNPVYNAYENQMFSLFKWQWDKMHNDINLTKGV